jgi:Short C-terminal domain
MIGRPMVVRRRPLLRAAAVGGTYAAGRSMGRRAEQQDAAEAAQDQRISDVENQQAQQAVPTQGGPAGSEASLMDQLSRLSTLHQQGALTDDEFAAAKAKVLEG